MLINKNLKSNQTCYEDYVTWTNAHIIGTCFAERHEKLVLNWIDTKDKSPAEIAWDDIRGKSLLKKGIREVLKEIEGEKDA